MSRHEWDGAGVRDGGLRKQFVDDARQLGRAVHELTGERGQPTPVDHVVANLDDGLSLAVQLACDPAAGSLPPPDRALWLALLAWLAVRGLGGLSTVPDRNRRCRQRMHEWGLGDVVAEALRDTGRTQAQARRGAEAVAAIQELPMWSPNRPTADASAVLASWLADGGTRHALEVQPDRDGVERFDTAAYDELAGWTTWVAAVRLAEYPQAYQGASAPMLVWVTAMHRELLRARVAAGDRVDGLPSTPGRA